MLDEIEHFIIEDLQRGFISQEPKVVPRPELAPPSIAETVTQTAADDAPLSASSGTSLVTSKLEIPLSGDAVRSISAEPGFVVCPFAMSQSYVQWMARISEKPREPTKPGADSDTLTYENDSRNASNPNNANAQHCLIGIENGLLPRVRNNNAADETRKNQESSGPPTVKPQTEEEDVASALESVVAYLAGHTEDSSPDSANRSQTSSNFMICEEQGGPLHSQVPTEPMSEATLSVDADDLNDIEEGHLGASVSEAADQKNAETDALKTADDRPRGKPVSPVIVEFIFGSEVRKVAGSDEVAKPYDHLLFLDVPPGPRVLCRKLFFDACERNRCLLIVEPYWKDEHVPDDPIGYIHEALSGRVVRRVANTFKENGILVYGIGAIWFQRRNLQVINFLSVLNSQLPMPVLAIPAAKFYLKQYRTGETLVPLDLRHLTGYKSSISYPTPSTGCYLMNMIDFYEKLVGEELKPGDCESSMRTMVPQQAQRLEVALHGVRLVIPQDPHRRYRFRHFVFPSGEQQIMLEHEKYGLIAVRAFYELEFNCTIQLPHMPLVVVGNKHMEIPIPMELVFVDLFSSSSTFSRQNTPYLDDSAALADEKQQIPVRYSPTARNVPQARAKNLQPIPESVEFAQFLSRTLFVARLYGEFANEDEFARLFSQFGRIDRVMFLTDERERYKSRGFVTFDSPAGASNALLTTSGTICYGSGRWVVSRADHHTVQLLINELAINASKGPAVGRNVPLPLHAHVPILGQGDSRNQHPADKLSSAVYRQQPIHLNELEQFSRGRSTPIGNTSFANMSQRSSETTTLDQTDARSASTIVDSKLPEYLYPGEAHNAQMDLFSQRLEIESTHSALGDEDADMPPNMNHELHCGKQNCAYCYQLFSLSKRATNSVLLENCITGEMKRVPEFAVPDYISNKWSPWQATEDDPTAESSFFEAWFYPFNVQ